MNNLSSNPFGNKAQSNPMAQQLNGMLRQVKQFGNPQQAINNLIQRNPQFATYMRGVQNPQQEVMRLMNQAGINIDDVMRGL